MLSLKEHIFIKFPQMGTILFKIVCFLVLFPLFIKVLWLNRVENMGNCLFEDNLLLGSNRLFMVIGYF